MATYVILSRFSPEAFREAKEFNGSVDGREEEDEDEEYEEEEEKEEDEEDEEDEEENWQ